MIQVFQVQLSLNKKLMRTLILSFLNHLNPRCTFSDPHVLAVWPYYESMPIGIVIKCIKPFLITFEAVSLRASHYSLLLDRTVIFFDSSEHLSINTFFDP